MAVPFCFISGTAINTLLHNPYDYIYFKTHGYTYCGYPCIITGEDVSYSVLNHYGKDMGKRRVVAVYTKARGNRIWAYPKLLTDHYKKDLNLDAGLVSVSCCRGGYNRKLATAFLRSGANAVTAYDETVYTSYDYYMTRYELNLMLDGNTIAKAVAAAKKKYGKTDKVWADDNNIHKKGKKTAQQWIFGVNRTTLYPQLMNWSFLKWGSSSDYYATLSNWRKYGNAKAVTRQGTIVARYNFMARISTKGRGEKGQSYIYQTFLVPEGVDTLEFDYQVLTTDYGSDPRGYDYFQADLLDQYGNVMETLAYESVNSGKWYWNSSTGFKGNSSVAVTGWKHAEFYRLYQYQGEVVTLRFRVKDMGNPENYTGALISCIWIE